MTFEPFYYAVQDALKVFICFPILCAIFRAIFIAVYNPYPTLKGKWGIIGGCFRYGFWWGMDYNAYLFLIPMLVVGLPAVFWPQIETVYGTSIRLVIGCAYALVLYAFFMAKMMFYKHFHDIFNSQIHMAGHAEKNNLRDVFFNEDHGLLWIVGVLPYIVAVGFALYGMLQIPLIPYYHVDINWLQYIANFILVLTAVAFFYWIRYGGTFMHDDKPEWDTIPTKVKEDIFFARATVDDLVAYKWAKRKQLSSYLTKSDEEMNQAITRLVPEKYKASWQSLKNPLYAFKRKTNGFKIGKPSQIFLIVGESVPQWAFDDIFKDLHIVDATKAFMDDLHTARVTTALPAGNMSRPSIVSLMSGVYDAQLELNEREEMWTHTLPTAMAAQLKGLGYQTIYWYGGNASYGNFNKYGKANGFDRVESATHFCSTDAPKTWVGVYDDVFLKMVAQKTEELEKPTFHFVYTTSNHSPYKIPDEILGYDADKALANVGEDIRRDKRKVKELATAYYSDQATQDFIKSILAAHPDALVVYTGDHSNLYAHLNNTSMLPRDWTIRELFCTPILIHHKDITQDTFGQVPIGSHMNIMPTILDLIAPKGMTYYSLVPPLTEAQPDILATPMQWISQKEIGTVETKLVEELILPARKESVLKRTPEDKRGLELAEDYATLSAWLVKHERTKLDIL